MVDLLEASYMGDFEERLSAISGEGVREVVREVEQGGDKPERFGYVEWYEPPF